MVKYLKWVLPMVAAGLSTLIAVLSDDKVTPTEWLMVASATLTTYVGAVTPTQSEKGGSDNGAG